jgi:asparagine synthase (glutamine-hydrolysing)
MEVWAKGHAFHAGRFRDSEGLARLLADKLENRPIRDVVGVVRELNGSFAVTVRARDGVFAAVDRLRSIPLFYGGRREEGGARSELKVSDDAFWVRQQTGDTSIDPVSEGEFIRAGYVFGRHTLSPSVRQLEPGQYLLMEMPNAKCQTSNCRDPGVDVEFYYRHVHGPYLDLDEAGYFNQLDAVSNNVFRRLVESVQGRTILLPLSSGYDSRYIAAMLKTLGYERVVCYTYGRTGSFEVATSREVAKKLGFPWHYVEYNRDTWRDFFHSEAAAEYNVFAGNLASLPCLQDSIAVATLMRNAVVPEDAVVVPGYAGATGFPVPAAGHGARGSRRLTRELIEFTFDENFLLANQVSPAVAAGIREHRARTFLDLPTPESIDEVVSVNEAWFTIHRLSRFIVNAVRVYEFNGYEWRMPLWDNELTEYWYRVPEELRADRRLYEAYLRQRVFAAHGIDWKRHTKRRGPLLGLGRRVLAALLPARAVQGVKKSYHRLGSGAGDINAFSEISRLYREDIGPGGARVEGPETDVCVAHSVWYVQALKDAAARGELAPKGLRPQAARHRQESRA